MSQFSPLGVKMTWKVFITSSEPEARIKVYNVPSPDLADEIVEYTINKSRADEIVYFTAFEERANKRVYAVNSDLYVDTYRPGVDSGNFYDPPESNTVQVWILMGVNLEDQDKYALALECFNKALRLDTHNRAARIERDKMQELLKPYQ